MLTAIRAYTLSECMEIMANYATENEVKGGRNLIFCEDRLTLIAERALTAQKGGSFFSSVSTFSRFLQKGNGVLSKQGSVMAVGKIMARLQRENALQCFTTSTGIGNNAKCIYETLAQFSASEITPEVLNESLALLDDEVLKKKIADLSKIHAEYIRFLAENGLKDESSYLSLLPNKIREHKGIQDTTVFFLCYSSFTAQAVKTLRACMESAKNVIGIFCGGEEDIYTNCAYDIFTRVANEYETPKTLNLGTRLDGEAELLRKGLFNPEQCKARYQTKAIKAFEAEDKTGEAEYIAVQIRRAMTEDCALRYKDFALLVPSVASYSLVLKRALEEYGIPYFIDEKKSLKSHPLSFFLLDCLRVVKEKFSPVAVQSLAQNYFFGESDNYRNYLLKFANYRGGAKREIKNIDAVTSVFDYDTLVDGRARLLGATEDIRFNATGAQYCLAVRKILQKFNAYERLQTLCDEMDEPSQKAYLAKIPKKLDELLTEAEQLTGQTEMSVGEFSAILLDGLDATEISLIPSKADAVFVGDLADSRIEKVHTLFALGMTEEVPRFAHDTAIISDKEIANLAQVKTLLEPTVAQVNLRSRESVCLNLCTFTNGLFLSYPLSADGNEPAVSEIFHYIDNIFCDENGNAIARKKAFDEDEFPYACCAPTPAVRQLLIEKNIFENTKSNDAKRALIAKIRHSSLFTALDKLSVRHKQEYLSKGIGQVCIERGEELFFQYGKISPTALEGYFSCPFKNFAERGLQLKDRDETAVLAVDTGNFIHELLELITKDIENIHTEDELYRYALSQGEKLLQSPLYLAQSETASGQFFSQKLLQEGARVCLAVYRQIKNSQFTVEETEKAVSTEFLRGKIDRVDGTDKYLRIVDYKTGTIDDTAISYYTGRKMQMQLYMSAVKGERIPAGVFYFPAQVDYTDNEDGKFRMRGFLNGDEDALKAGDTTLTENAQSEYFPATLGANGRSKRVMDEQTFRDFLDYSVLVARQACEEIKDGYIVPTPYATSCAYCKLGGMCGFNCEKQTPRNEKSIEPTEIAEIAKTVRDGKDNG